MYVSQTIAYLSQTVSFVESFSTVIIELVSELRSALKELDSLDGDITPLRKALIDCKSLVSKANITANTVLDRAETCLKYGDITDDHKRKICESFKKGICKPLNIYLGQLHRYFKQCEECYESFKCHHEHATVACVKGADECSKRINETSGTGISTTGRVATAVGVTGGVAGATAATVMGASVIAGVLTMGIGTPIVLGIGSVIGGAVTTAVGAAMVATGSHYERLCKHFDSISKKFTDMEELAKSQDEVMHEVMEKLKDVDYNRETVDKIANEDKDEDSFEKAFNILLKSIKDSLSKVEKGRKKLEWIKKDLKELT